MAPVKLSGTGKPRQAQLKWTHRMRLALYLMESDFSLKSSMRTAAFNIMFAEYIAECGLAMAPESALRAQLGEKNYVSRAHLWSQILRPSDTTEERTRRQAMRDEISDALEKIHLSGSTTKAQVATPSSRSAFTKRRQRSPDSAYSTLNDSPRPRKIAFVVIPKDPARILIPVPQTPRRSYPISPPRSNATIEYPRRNGPTLFLTPQQLAMTQQEYTPPTDAQPKVLPPLFFRFWTSASQGLNTAGNGFVAGRYVTSNVMRGPPSPSEIDPADVFNHVNRERVASPFLSVSNCFSWSLRNGLKEFKKSGLDVNISVIASEAMDRRCIYYCSPFVKELKKKRPFTNGAFMFYSSHEYLVWHEIPASAVINTVRLQDFLQRANTSPMMAQLFQILPIRGNYRTKIIGLMRNCNNQLNSDLSRVIAQVVLAIGLSHASPLDHLVVVVGDILQGFGIVIRHQTPDEFRGLASMFAHTLCRASEYPVDGREVEKLKMAMLLGIKFGLGEINVRHSAQKLRKMERRAISIGLENPASILANELDGAKLQLYLHQKAHERLLNDTPSQRLLEDVLLDDQSEDDLTEVESVLEMDEEGYVVL